MFLDWTDTLWPVVPVIEAQPLIRIDEVTANKINDLFVFCIFEMLPWLVNLNKELFSFQNTKNLINNDLYTNDNQNSISTIYGSIMIIWAK